MLEPIPTYLIKNARLVNEGRTYESDVLLSGGRIERIDDHISPKNNLVAVVDGGGKLLLPGVIDTQVHFREPGLTHKADLTTESMAAVAGGVTSYIEQPNTVPAATTLELLEAKFARAAEVFAGVTVTAADIRLDYGEPRFTTVGVLDGRMVILVWTPRGEARRIISMRKANEREIAKFAPALG